MTKKQNTEQATELTLFNENATAIEKSVATVFDPRTVRKSLEKTKAHIAAVTAAHQTLNFAEYKVLYNAYVDKMFEADIYVDSKYNIQHYNDFIKWAKDKMNVGRSNAYAAVKVGKYIKDDASGTTLYKYGEGDYSFNALVKLFECADIYEGKGKDKKLKIVPIDMAVRDKDGYIVFDTVFNEKGVPIRKTRKVAPLLDENGKQVNGTLIDYLCYTGVIHQNMSISELSKALKEYFHPTIIDLPKDNAEKTADNAEETADNAEETADNAEETADNCNIVLTPQHLKMLRDMLIGNEVDGAIAIIDGWINEIN